MRLCNFWKRGIFEYISNVEGMLMEIEGSEAESNGKRGVERVLCIKSSGSCV